MRRPGLRTRTSTVASVPACSVSGNTGWRSAANLGVIGAPATMRVQPPSARGRKACTSRSAEGRPAARHCGRHHPDCATGSAATRQRRCSPVAANARWPRASGFQLALHDGVGRERTGRILQHLRHRRQVALGRDAQSRTAACANAEAGATRGEQQAHQRACRRLSAGRHGFPLRGVRHAAPRDNNWGVTL